MKRMTFVAICALAGSACAADAWEIDKEMAKGEFWESDPMLLMSDCGKRGFSFTSGEKTAADCRQAGAVTCFGFASFETIIRFGEETGLASVEVSFYNKGGVEKIELKELDDGTTIRRRSRDDREISREEFVKIVREVSEKLTAPGAKPPKTENGKMRNAELSQQEKNWKKCVFGGPAKLSWSYRQKGKDKASFEPGYIKLVAERPDAGKTRPSGAKAAPQTKGAAKITDNILRDSRGTHLDNVPMVDQGMKGYCAAATSERVLRYYGVDVDEHEIAELAGTSADRGTSTRAMKDSVEKVGRKYHLGTSLCYGDFDENVEKRISGIVKEVDNYNKAAKKLKCRPITADMYIRHEGNMTCYDVSAVDKAMEPRVLVEMKSHGAQASGYKKFLKDVRDQINRGIPLFWGVKLGVASEPEIPQTMGYHMRLVIGYNDKKNEIVYTDSWGAGHEFKTMRADWAWTITKSLFYLKPLTR